MSNYLTQTQILVAELATRLLASESAVVLGHDWPDRLDKAVQMARAVIAHVQATEPRVPNPPPPIADVGGLERRGL